MTPLYHSNLFTIVNKINASEISAQAVLLSTGWEATATIRAAAATFAIDDASWLIVRSPGGAHNGGRQVPALRGVEACLGSGPALRAAAGGEGDIPYRLFAECVKGIIQAETYLFRERGFPDAATYESHWKQNFADSCRLYSNQHRITRDWYEHVADRAWSDLLFTRTKTAAVTAGPGDALTVAGGFTDSFHELAITLTAAAGQITAATGNFLRAPDPVCVENLAALGALVGIPLAAPHKNAARIVGGPQGCIHMADLVDHCLQALHAAGYGRG